MTPNGFWSVGWGILELRVAQAIRTERVTIITRMSFVSLSFLSTSLAG